MCNSLVLCTVRGTNRIAYVKTGASPFLLLHPLTGSDRDARRASCCCRETFRTIDAQVWSNDGQTWSTEKPSAFSVSVTLDPFAVV